MEQLLADAFLAGYADRTREAYEHDLAEFRTWCATREPAFAVLEATRSHVQLYVRHLERIGRAPATIARKLAVVSGFYGYCAAEDAITKNPVTYVRRPKVADESPRFGLSVTELQAFLTCAHRLGPIEHALACLLAFNGLRISEACGATVDDLVDDDGPKLTVHRKGGKLAHVPLTPRTLKALEALPSVTGVDAWAAGAASSPSTAPASLLGVDRFQAWRIVKRIAEHAGITKTISPHSLRHTFATLALEAGVPLHVVQDAMSHSNPTTTRRYDRARGQQIARATDAIDKLTGDL